MGNCSKSNNDNNRNTRKTEKDRLFFFFRAISGDEVGCQGEIGTACSKAAETTAYLIGGSPLQKEYAAEMRIEHHIGLTCNPFQNYVQISCIERNAFAFILLKGGKKW